MQYAPAAAVVLSETDSTPMRDAVMFKLGDTLSTVTMSAVESLLQEAVSTEAIGALNSKNCMTYAATACGAFVGFENVTVMMSPTETIGTTGGGLDAIMDTIPGQHTTEPAVLFSYCAHGVHTTTPVAFSALE
jgi:hypothetical protein